jgi:glycosyltransferase involved in cell wall biosynthesis
MQRKISIVIPVYNMVNAYYFLRRNLVSIAKQTFRNFEIIISDDTDTENLKETLMGILAEVQLGCLYVKNPRAPGMANNTNNAIDNAQGKLVKILFQDDYFYDQDSLAKIVEHFTPTTRWLVTGCTHSLDGVTTFNDHHPYYSESENTIGSPSVITFPRDVPIRFDPNFYWVLDLDFYKQLYRKYGKPKIYDQVNVVIGVGMHQETNNLSDERKAKEHQLLKLKYEQSVKT